MEITHLLIWRCDVLAVLLFAHSYRTVGRWSHADDEARRHPLPLIAWKKREKIRYYFHPPNRFGRRPTLVITIYCNIIMIILSLKPERGRYRREAVVLFHPAARTLACRRPIFQAPWIRPDSICELLWRTPCHGRRLHRTIKEVQPAVIVGHTSPADVWTIISKQEDLMLLICCVRNRVLTLPGNNRWIWQISLWTWFFKEMAAIMEASFPICNGAFAALHTGAEEIPVHRK